MPETTSTRPQEPEARQYFDNVAIDNLMTVVLELGAAQWVTRERLALIEKLLAEKGVVTAEMIEMHRPSDEEKAQSKTDRDAFIARLYGAFGRTPVMSKDLS